MASKPSIHPLLQYRWKRTQCLKQNLMQGTKDKVIVITGASSGIGEATAVMLAERGAKVVLGARGLERLEGLARRIAGAGGEVAYAQTDDDSTIARISRFSKTRCSRSPRFRIVTSTMARAKSSARITWFGNSARNTG